MKRVFTSAPISADGEILKGLLDEAGIPCMIRNEHLAMALGELAPSDCSPETGFLMTQITQEPKRSLTTYENLTWKPTNPGFALIAAKRLKVNSLHVGNVEKIGRQMNNWR